MKSKKTIIGAGSTSPASAGSPPFVPGDSVVSEFFRDEAQVVRRIEMCVADSKCGSGWRASADEGGACPHCKRPNGRAVRNVDATWFKMANAAAYLPGGENNHE